MSSRYIIVQHTIAIFLITVALLNKGKGGKKDAWPYQYRCSECCRTDCVTNKTR